MEKQREMAAMSAAIMRANALQEIAVGMWYDRSGAEKPFGDIHVALDSRDAHTGQPNLTFAVDTARSPFAVARGEADISFFNPSAYLTMAYRGTGPFATPLPLRALAVFPSWDRMGFAVARKTGIASLGEIGDRKAPLRISVRAADDDTTRFVVDEVLATMGFSLADVVSWGGSIHRAGTPRDPGRIAGIEDGTIDAVFDEGINAWLRVALENDMMPLPIEGPAQKRMRDLGWQVRSIPEAWHSIMLGDVMSVSFSGWPLFTRDTLPEEIAYRICQSLDAHRGTIPFDLDRPVELTDLCTDSDFAPLEVPLHEGAARYYRENGALLL